MQSVSPKYLMFLVKKVHDAIWAEYGSYKEVKLYISKWHHQEYDWNNHWENFSIVSKNDKGDIDLSATLHGIDGETLLKIAVDIGVETPDFIPSIPIFRNEIKSTYSTASNTFEKAFKQIEDHPDIAIGLVNSALESIIKEIIKDDRIKISLKGNETLYALTGEILKVFQLFPNSNIPVEIRTIGSSLLSISQSIEKLRSDKTNFHGKTEDDYIIKDSIYTYFIVNAVATIGLFLKKYYENKFPLLVLKQNDIYIDDLPF